MDSASRRFRDNPSFSSTLLNDIYRSIDEQPTQSLRNKQTKFGGINKSRNGCFQDDQRRACMIPNWMESKAPHKPVTGRRSAADLETTSMRYARESICSSEIKPKPIRTTTGVYDIIKQRQDDSQTKGKFVKTKSKALKIYGDLKKVKQPISPGGRLATFINSLFTTGNNKKPSTSSVTGGGYPVMTHLDTKSKSANASTCSSASSFSRSCLTNTPSSRGDGIKRSVRFYLVDQDCQPSGPKSEETNSIGQSSVNKLNLSDKNRHISEAARSLLKNYKNKVEDEYENQSEDDGSDSSSDLFELHNLGMHRYREELPVYETTQLDTNRHFM